MKWLAATALGLAVSLLAGCHHVSPLSAELQAKFEAEANRPITCSKGSDCDEKWGRAIEWVQHHTRYELKTVSNKMIKTGGRQKVDGGPSYAEFIILKYPKGQDLSVIVYSSFCDGIFECKPSGIETKANFVDYVLDLSPVTP